MPKRQIRINCIKYRVGETYYRKNRTRAEISDTEAARVPIFLRPNIAERNLTATRYFYVAPLFWPGI